MVNNFVGKKTTSRKVWAIGVAGVKNIKRGRLKALPREQKIKILNIKIRGKEKGNI